MAKRTKARGPAVRPRTRNSGVAAAMRRSASSLVECSRSDFALAHHPSTAVIARLLDDIRALLFPSFFLEGFRNDGALAASLEGLMASVLEDLAHELSGALHRGPGARDGLLACRSRAEGLSVELLSALPIIRRALDLDLEEVLARDPAAKDREEVILAYPGFEALTTHRVAHFLHERGVPLVPRIMSEIVHRRTGIDIHPGATIAPWCSIDHGTGLIIGETTVIGRHVSLYHNVTLGARSVSPEQRNKKRHPTIGDNVIIYPGATILGDILVGGGSVIGGNVFLMESCPPDTVILAEPMKTVRRAKKASASR